MGLWAQMTEVERVAHSIRHGNKYHLRDSKAGLLDQAAAYNDDRAQRYTNGTPGAAPGDAPPPPGVSQYIWDRINAGTLDGLNLASITHGSGATRDALIAAGHEDYVKKAYEQAMRQRAAHYGGNGAEDAWSTAQFDWYSQRYGDFHDGSVKNQTPGLSFGGGSPRVSYDPSGNATGTSRPTGGPATPSTPSAPQVNLNPYQGGGFMSAYSTARAAAPQQAAPQQAAAQPMTARQATPYLDAYVRATDRSTAEGPVTTTMKKFLDE